MGQQQSGFGGKRDDRSGGDGDKVRIHTYSLISIFSI